MDVGNDGEGPEWGDEHGFTPGCSEPAVPKDSQVAYLAFQQALVLAPLLRNDFGKMDFKCFSDRHGSFQSPGQMETAGG